MKRADAKAVNASILYSGLRTPILFRSAGLVCLAYLASSTVPQSTQRVQAAPAVALSQATKAMLLTINPRELKGDLSFLASDTLQGRYTPSPGLDVAAEFIASKFRAAGLEPGGDQDYFQTANMVDRQMPTPSAEITIRDGSEASTIPASSYVIYSVSQAAAIKAAQVIVFPSRDLQTLKKTDVSGKAVLVKDIDFKSLSQSQAQAEYIHMLRFDGEVARSNAAVEIVVSQKKPRVADPKLLSSESAAKHSIPLLIIENEQLKTLLNHPEASGQPQTVTLDIPAPADRNVMVKNVIGVLRGSDLQLKNTCVLLTAHYDHIGTTDTAGNSGVAPKATEAADHIYNGANDDGSGTVSVIEIARAMATLHPHPKRSIVFMTFFGEERGELGSKFYGAHPIFSIAKTVADVNLEQVGRTDSTAGKQINTASLTGYDYSDVTKYLEAAGRLTGVKVYLDKDASDAYFTRSDNAALALQGVPAHSLTVAFDYPDYHSVGDEWQKVDFDNMTRVDRMIALGLLRIANDPQAPQWNARNPKTLPFREAQAKSRTQ